MNPEENKHEPQKARIILIAGKHAIFKNGTLRHSKLLGTLWSVSSSLVPDDSSLPLSLLRTQPKIQN